MLLVKRFETYTRILHLILSGAEISETWWSNSQILVKIRENNNSKQRFHVFTNGNLKLLGKIRFQNYSIGSC